MANKTIHVIGGGTVFHVRPHLALAAPAYGGTARRLAELLHQHRLGQTLDVALHLTRMADSGRGDLETNDDVAHLLARLTADPATKAIFLPAALCDWEGSIDGQAGKDAPRLQSRAQDRVSLDLVPAAKVVGAIRHQRKDIFAVAWKATTGLSPEEQYLAGLNLLKEASVNLVFANDLHTRLHMVITPEEAKYAVTTDREAALRELVDISLHRCQLTFTRSTVVAGEPVPWDSPLVPGALRAVVDHCIARGAYKPFRGATVGHFACKLDERTFLTSIRKSNFNDLGKTGLVKVVTDGEDSVIAYGARPSVGGQSQRIVFHDHADYDCIVHFHCPKKAGSDVPEVSQREYECGSHQCGENTSKGLQRYGRLSAVYLQEHGPNVVFHRSIDPAEVIRFIEDNFDLEAKTGGYVSLGQILKTPDTLDTLKALTGSGGPGWQASR